MNKYEKKKNILQTLLEIGYTHTAIIFMLFIIVPFFIGFPVLEIPYISNKVGPYDIIQHFALAYLIGWIVIGIVYLGYLCVLVVAQIINSINISLYAARIMQYLPLSAKDWEQLGAKTDEEAIHILRDLVKTVGYRSDLKKCEELRDEIVESYRAFLVYKYGEDYTVTFNNASSLVLCSDEDFDELLQNAYDDYNNEERSFPKFIY